jgi:diamine N-acetyltransferase
MSELEIVRVEGDQVDRLVDISRSTFAEAFEALNNPIDFKLYVLSAFNSLQLRKELEDPLSEFYFAYLNQQLTAYLKLNFGVNQTDLKEPTGMEIERIYTLKEFQNLKIGKQLIDFATSKAEERDLDYIWLGVWENNPRAIKFYESFGFHRIGEHIYNVGNDPQNDWVMKLDIKKGRKWRSDTYLKGRNDSQ